jgi:hypothetical protein
MVGRRAGPKRRPERRRYAACPGPRIYELDDTGFVACGYDKLDVVRLMRGFLAEPDRYLRAALAAIDPE